ncbi:hypothetical protein [Sphingomonas carotinifaciens]|uniref:hypothetical protein n=1 Tax=Sphingomonas carotinifaciens TaxID=1166323 RepID=UPI0013DEBA59|nr:hypothetical protein [Sphingomonas carotinifaciens]MBB4088149.1 hypothetical protein [Sphingomonas carotinifaciens]
MKVRLTLLQSGVGQHPLGGFGGDDEQAGDLTIAVENARIGEGEPGVCRASKRTCLLLNELPPLVNERHQRGAQQILSIG